MREEMLPRLRQSHAHRDSEEGNGEIDHVFGFGNDDEFAAETSHLAQVMLAYYSLGL